MKKAVHESKSLKTFYIYAILVLILIVISMAIKGFFIIEQSKFDPSHQFTLAVISQNNVKEIISFQPQNPSIAILDITDNGLPYGTLAKNYGIAADGYIQGIDLSPSNDTTSLLWASIIHTATWHSDLTIVDKIRLLLVSKNVINSNKTNTDVSLVNQNAETNTVIANALTDQDLASENISIQIINATGVSGLGQRLGRVLTNMGADVVDVSTAQNSQEHSTLAYYGNESYTLKRLEKIFGVTATKFSRQQIADIIITIGNDRKEKQKF